MSQIYIWDGFTDFKAPHRKLFDFNRHIWTEDFLNLIGQPLLCFGIEWSGSRRHGGWKGTYHLAYWGKQTESKDFSNEEICPICNQPTQHYYHPHKVEVGEDTIIWKRRDDLSTMRKELSPFIKGIKVDRIGEEYVVDQPPVDWDKIKPYYKSTDKRLHFPDEEKLKLFISYCWGSEKLIILGKVADVKTTTLKKQQKITRVDALVRAIEDSEK